MCKKMMTIIIGCAILATAVLAGCGEDVPNTQNIGINSSVTENSGTENGSADTAVTTASENSSTAGAGDTVATESDENGEIIVDDTAHDEYEFVDETVTNPTVAPYEVSTESENAKTVNDITVDSLAGSWNPLVVTNVSDGKELGFTEAFGSAYSKYGGFLEIEEGGSFTISMGAAIKGGRTNGTFTLSQYNMLVTYEDGSTDTFLYIPDYLIKTQIDSYYVYFYKIS
ncbi:MAG: hypothetical protein U0M12_03910 [Acutalibacteraceae bacterium]|nr:hypothetical protein [Acutalibacteraceae bacterium]